MSRHSRISPESSPSLGSRLGRILNGRFRMASTNCSPRLRQSARSSGSSGDCDCGGGGGVVAKPRLAGSPPAARRATSTGAHANKVSRRRSIMGGEGRVRREVMLCRGGRCGQEVVLVFTKLSPRKLMTGRQLSFLKSDDSSLEPLGVSSSSRSSPMSIFQFVGMYEGWGFRLLSVR